MSKKTMKFCAHCGERHKPTEKICPKCKNKLPIKNGELKKYIKDHIKDNLKGKLTDSSLDLIKNYIISNLYGTILTISVIATITTIGITHVDDFNKYEKVSEKPPSLVNIANSETNLPQEELTPREQLSITYFDMFLNNEVNNIRRSIYYEDYNPNYYFDLIFLNSYGPYFSKPDIMKIDKLGTCSTESKVLDELPDITNIKNEGYEFTECTHKLSYCKSGNCEETGTYEYEVDVIVGYIKVEDKWFILYDRQIDDGYFYDYINS